jgi:bifunctional DNA-binding transcriptional regulator/antitoxin component of YhaV-PrlF toxin-antitoxin module
VEDNCNTEGQIRIPVEVRRRYGMGEGTKIQSLEARAGLMPRPIPDIRHRVDLQEHEL